MYKKVLVPLDGSDLSGCALEHVKAIATGCNVAEVVLLRVVEPLSSETIAALATAGKDRLRDLEVANQTEARQYVAKVGSDLKREGIASKPVTVDGNPAEEILSYARDNQVDLIIMSTHGRSGVSRWFFGSVADRVVRHSAIPVLVISPPGCRVPTK